MVKNKRVFVTVGTTQFNDLIEIVSSTEILEILRNLGYNEIQFQTGAGIVNKMSHPNITLLYDKYFEDFGEQIDLADLIISHAGAGTCLEVLRKHKPLIVVINESLMDNHQTELAEQLESDGYLYFCTCQTLKDALIKDLKQLKPYPKPNDNLFSDYLDKCMGFV